MLYQISGVLLLPILGIDLVLVVALYFLPRHQQRRIRIVRYGVIVLLALTTSFLKLLGASPTPLASTPIHIIVKSEQSDVFRSFYYLAQHQYQPFVVYWKSYMPGQQSDDVLDSESVNLFVAIKRHGQWLITPIHNIPGTFEAAIDLDKARFLPDRTGAVAQAIAAHRKWEAGNYLSSFLTLVLVVLLVQRLRYLGSGGARATWPAPAWQSSSS